MSKTGLGKKVKKLAAPAGEIGGWTVADIRRSDILVFRENETQYVKSVVHPNGLQVGLTDSNFLSNLLVTGHITGSGYIYAKKGFTGSLQTLIDGSNYLVGGSGITVTNNSNGSITIESDSSSSGESRIKNYPAVSAINAYANLAVPGIFFATYGYSKNSIDVFYNGELMKSGSAYGSGNSDALGVATDVDYSLGVDSQTGGIINFGFPLAPSDDIAVLVGAGGSGGGGSVSPGIGLSLDSSSVFNVDLDGTTINANSSDQLQVLKVPNTLIGGNGIDTLTYDGSSPGSIQVKPVSGGPITVGSNGVGFDIQNLGALSLANTDELIISKGGTIGKTTVSTLLGLSTGGNSSGGASIIAPFAYASMTDTPSTGTGTACTWSYASQNRIFTVTFDTAQSNTNYTVVTDEEFADGTGSRYMIVQNKTTAGFEVQMHSSYGPSQDPKVIMVYGETPTVSVGGASANAAYLVATSTGDLSAERVLTAGNGISVSDGGANGQMTVSALLKTASGLQFVSGELAVKIGDFTGVGLSANNSTGKIDLDLSAMAGAGLTEAANQLSVDFGTSAGTSAEGNNTVNIIAGDGLTGGGSFQVGAASSSITIDLATTDLAGKGLVTNNNNLDLWIAGSGGISIVTGSNGEFIIDGSSFSTGESNASDSSAGLLQIATNAEATAATANDKALVPSNLSSINISNFTNDSNYLTSVGFNNLTTDAVTISSESFVDNDTTLMTSAAINDLIESKGYDAGDITKVTAGVGLSGGGDTGDVTLDIDINGLSEDSSGPAHGDFIAYADIDDSNAVKKLSINDLTEFQTGWSNSSGYGIAAFNGRLYLKPNDMVAATDVNPADDILIIEDASDSSTVAKKTGISDLISAVGGDGLEAVSGVLSVDYIGDDSLIKSATDGTSITIDYDNDLLLVQDHSDAGTIKYIKPSQITSNSSGVIGPPEGNPDNTYTDGLFSTFTNSTPTGTAIDKINEVLKLLAPSPAPEVNSINTPSSGISAKLSFGSSNTGGSTYADSTNAAGLNAVDTNGTYSFDGSGTHKRLGIFLTDTTVEGIINHDVLIAQYANGTINYVADSFANGELGILKLFVNDSSTPKHTVDLSSFTGAGNPGSGTGSDFGGSQNTSGFYQMSIAKSATSEGGTSFNIFKHRTGKYRVHHDDQRQGWNYAKVVHTVGSTDYTTNFIEWVNDTDTTTIGDSGVSVSNIVGSDEFVLSGIKYFKTASFDYNATINNAFKGLHTSTPIDFNSEYGSITTATDQNAVNLINVFPSVESGEDFTKTINISASGTFNVASDGFPSSGLLNGTNTVSMDIVHPNTNKNQNALGSTNVTGLLMWFPTSNSEEGEGGSENGLEDFNNETWRQQAGNYATQSDIYNTSTNEYVTPWNSATKVSSNDAGHNTGLVQYQGKLVAPRNTLLNGNFASVTNGPGSNADYSGITTGIRTYYRSFKKNSAGVVRDIRVRLNGDGTLVPHGTSLGANDNFKCFIKVPETTGWMDLASPFVLDSTGDNDGAYVTNLVTDINGAVDNYASFGLETIAQNDRILIKIEADAGWTGYLNSINIKFGASSGDESSVPDHCSSINSTTGDGVSAKLSFGASQGIPASDTNHPYENVAGSYSLTNADINNEYVAVTNGVVRGIYDGSAIHTGIVNSGEAGDPDNFASHAIRYGDEGVIKLIVNDVEKHSINLASTAGFGAPGSGVTLDTNGAGSGFSNISTAEYVTWSDDIPDYRYKVRTMHWRVVAGDQRPGHNWVQVVHTIGSTDYSTNYVEWVNDPTGGSVSFSNVDLADFTDSDIAYLSGIKYFKSPSTTFKYRVENMHRNVYHRGANALGFIGPTNAIITNLEISGVGIQDPADVASTLRTAVPSLLTNSDTNYTLPMDVTGSFDYKPGSQSTPYKTLPGTYGTSANNVTINAKAYHPLTNASGASQSASKNNFLVWTPTQTTNTSQHLPPLSEDFSGERYRLKDVTFSTVNDITGNYWDPQESLVGNGSGGNAGHNTGMCIYNGHLIPPSEAGNSGDFSTGLQGPAGNVDYSLSNVTTSTRTYIRHFYNTGTGDSVGNFTISMTGTGSLKAETGSLNQAALQAGNSNFYMKIKIVYPASPQSEADKTTGWLDCGTNINNYGNTDGDGCSAEENDDLNVVWNNNTQSVSILYPTDRGLYGTSSSFSRNYVIIKIETHKEWTGKFTALSITP